jgi:hypothetical protein
MLITTMWRDAAKRLDDVETEKMNVYILQVMSILRQSYCSPKYLYFLLPGQEKPVKLRLRRWGLIHAGICCCGHRDHSGDGAAVSLAGA